MSNGSLGSWSTLNASGEDIGVENGTWLPNFEDFFRDIFSLNSVTGIIISVFIVIISIFGLMGNGTVLWFLGFCMKRNHFTTFILHLAAADLGTLICLFPFSIIHLLWSFSPLPLYDYYLLSLFFDTYPLWFMYNTGQYLLTAISMDRCVSVVFPLWHRCHRPPHFSTLVCATIWIISFLLTAIDLILSIFNVTPYTFIFQFQMNAILCLPLMTVSTLVLFIKVYFRSQQGKAVTAILLALLFFLFLAFPYTFILLINHYSLDGNGTAVFFGLLCSCLNSSVNPLIYFLVARKKHSRSRQSLKFIFQRVFKEEEHGREEVELQVTRRYDASKESE